MRIKHITIEKLFGMFDYEIPFNLDERITIIHGKNGVGKTVILNLINDIFNKSFEKVFDTKFKTVKIVFQDDTYISLEKNDDYLEFIFAPINLEPQTLKIPKESNSDSKRASRSNYMISKLERDFDMGRISNEEFDYRMKKLTMDLRIGKPLQQLFLDLVEHNDKLVSIYKTLDVNIQFIKTQRLTVTVRTLTSEERTSHTVDKYAKDLSRDIQNLLLEHSSVALELERSFPLRLIEKKPENQLNEETIKQSLNDLEAKRLEYIGLGILEEQKEVTSFVFTETIAPDKLAVLKDIITDNEKKLRVFDTLAQKIKLFKELVNKRFSYKQIYFNKEEGFFFKNDLGDVIALKSLSSGEQHQLILFFDFLFNLKPNALIMIDEPELSLHVEWQRAFLSDYKRITKLAKIDLFIATHSPQLINGSWDLTVALGEETK
jgi:predicted ATP-binding protein involved in virulence